MECVTVSCLHQGPLMHVGPGGGEIDKGVQLNASLVERITGCALLSSSRGAAVQQMVMKSNRDTYDQSSDGEVIRTLQVLLLSEHLSFSHPYEYFENSSVMFEHISGETDSTCKDLRYHYCSLATLPWHKQ